MQLQQASRCSPLILIRLLFQRTADTWKRRNSIISRHHYDGNDVSVNWSLPIRKLPSFQYWGGNAVIMCNVQTRGREFVKTSLKGSKPEESSRTWIWTCPGLHTILLILGEPVAGHKISPVADFWCLLGLPVVHLFMQGSRDSLDYLSMQQYKFLKARVD